MESARRHISGPRRPRLALAVLAALAAAGLPAGAAGAASGAAEPAAETGTIYSVAGTGLFVRGGGAVAAPRGDGGPARLAPLDFPTGIAATPDGGFLIAEQYASRIRRVSARGVIRTVAGTGRAGLSGDGGAATRARLDYPSGVAALADGSIAIADQRNNRVRLVDSAGRIATLAAARWPDDVGAAADGGVLVVEALNNRVLHVSRAGVVSVVAGTGTGGFSGDGGPATQARLSRPRAVASTHDGGLLIADGTNRVRRVGADGIITTVAGDGSGRSGGDGGPATAAGVPRPAAVTETRDGGLLIASVNQIRRVRPDGTIVTVAGTGRGNYSGDAGPARRAHLWRPEGVAAAAGGGILVADTFDGRIRFIDSAVPGPAGPPVPPRLLAISFRRPIQRGEAGIVTHLRVSCPPRLVAVRFALDRNAAVSLAVSRAGRRVLVLRSRLRAGPHTLRFRVSATGEHALRLTATGGARQIAVDQAQLSVSACRRSPAAR